MLDDESYREWTKAFNEESYYQGSWDEGSKILFLGPDEETGKEMGMVSRIAENRQYEYISIEHLGVVKDGVEDTEGEEAKKWAPAFENYSFKEIEGGTVVTIDQDMQDEYFDMFNTMWDDALQRHKKLAEEN